MTPCERCDAKPTECIDCADAETLTDEERQHIQNYALASIARDPEKRPEKNTLIEDVIYCMAEWMKPAPVAVKEQVRREYLTALHNWRTA